MNFGYHRIKYKVHEQKLLDEMRTNFNKNTQFDYMLSFNTAKNFRQLVRASKKIISKPSRIAMKFETFDRKFSVCYVPSKFLEQICIQVRNYYDFFKRNRTIYVARR